MTRQDRAVVCNLINTKYTQVIRNRRWRLQVASSFGRKTPRLPDDVVPREGQQYKASGREGGNGDGNENVGGNENGARNESGDRDKNREEGGREREPGNLRSGNRDVRGVRSEDARGEGDANE